MTAPDLTEARDLAAMWQARAEAAEAIIAGRTTPPMPAEIEAAGKSGGGWRCVVGLPDGGVMWHEKNITVARADHNHAVAHGRSSRWWVFDRNGRPQPVAP